MIDINKAFEGRWRFKSQNLDKALEAMLIEYRVDHVKKLCRDFFEAGYLIASNKSRLCGDNTPATADFDTFWNLYDKKVGRNKCMRLWKKLSNEEKNACLAYIPLYVQAQPEKQYRKNPETFLRNKSWHDEIITHNEYRKPTTADLARKAARILQD